MNEEIKEEIRKKRDKLKKCNFAQPTGRSKSKNKREDYNNTCIPEHTRKISDKQPILHLNELEKEQSPSQHK